MEWSGLSKECQQSLGACRRNGQCCFAERRICRPAWADIGSQTRILQGTHRRGDHVRIGFRKSLRRGAPFAVLVAEELFACGCRTLISLTSAGQIVPAGSPPYFVVIDRALRDEGTSYHYEAIAVVD